MQLKCHQISLTLQPGSKEPRSCRPKLLAQLHSHCTADCAQFCKWMCRILEQTQGQLNQRKKRGSGRWYSLRSWPCVRFSPSCSPSSGHAFSTEGQFYWTRTLPKIRWAPKLVAEVWAWVHSIDGYLYVSCLRRRHRAATRQGPNQILLLVVSIVAVG